jgi:pyridoxamine 5'-phosphate oxidase
MENNENIQQMRREYNKGSFDIKNTDESPFKQFELWFKDAVDVKMLDPNAMILSTATKNGKPSSRGVLLKGYNDNGFVFFSNYESRKAKEMAENPQASLIFYWDKLDRQIRIEGKIEKISEKDSDAYYQTRSYTSRLGAWASKQSEVLKSRFTLIRKVAVYAAKYPVNPPLPPYWGGYRLIPDYFEFWQGRESRLHDRISYTLENNSWKIERLYP